MLWLKNIKYIDTTLVKYLVVGILNTFTGLLVIYFLKWQLDYDDITANILGYSVGITLSFILNKKWSFRHTGATVPSLIRFILVILVAYFSNLYTVIFLIEYLSANSYIAQAIGIIPYTLIGYLGSKLFAFKK